MKKYSDDYSMRTGPARDYAYCDPCDYGRYRPDDMQLPEEDDDDYAEERYEDERNYMLSLYPDVCKRIKAIVDKECDKLEAEDRIMYEEYPSKDAIEKIVANIYVTVIDELNIPIETQDIQSEEKSVESQQFFFPPRHRFLRDNIHVIFLHELFRRRRRRFPRRFRRRRFYPPYSYY